MCVASACAGRLTALSADANSAFTSPLASLQRELGPSPETRVLKFLQVVLQPADVTPDRPPPHVEVHRPSYEAETPVETVLVVVASN